MPVTVATVVSAVVGRVRGKLAATGLSAVRDATNPDVPAAVIKALGWVGVAPADPMAVTDADLLAVPAAAVPKFLDAATLETLYLCLGAADCVDEAVELESRKLSQVQGAIQDLINLYETRLRKPYGPGVPATAVGTAVAGNPLPNDPLNPWRSRVDPCTWPYPQ